MAVEQLRRDEVVEATSDLERTMQPQRVPVNVYETSGALVVVAPLPAVTPGDVTVEMHGQSLRFYARLRSAAPRQYLIHEWEYGGYEREIDVPRGFGGAVEASVTNGQLVVRVLRGETRDLIRVKPSGV